MTSDHWTKRLGKGLLSGAKKTGGGLLNAGAAAVDSGQRRAVQKQIRAVLQAARQHRDFTPVVDLLNAIPDNWEAGDLAASHKLKTTQIAALERAIDEAKAVKAKRADQEYIADTERALANDGAMLEVHAIQLLPESTVVELTEELAEEAKLGGSNEPYKKTRQRMERIKDPFLLIGALTYGRVVGDLRPQEKQALVVAVELAKQEIFSTSQLRTAVAVMVFNKGSTSIVKNDIDDERGFDRFRRETEHKMRQEMSSDIQSPNDIIQIIGNTISELEASKAPAEMVGAVRSAAGGGAQWFNSGDIPNSIYNAQAGNGLFLGGLGSKFLHYDGEGSLFTIAPPGSGKTQCQVMPNLLMYDGPAIVLDIKGECYQQTAGHRAQGGGKVVRFAPDDWDNSAHYNPLDFVRQEERYLASDARKLADMLIVPQASKDPYWEQRGRDVLAAMIGYVAYTYDGEKRTMQSVMDMLSPSPAMLEEVLDALRDTGISFLFRAANQIEGLGDNQRNSIFDSARSQLSVWDLGELDPITDRSDWHPQEFKRSENTLTLYICVSPADIKRFASVLRVIIGQHLDYFMEVLPENVDRPIVFFLDEAPQLGSFDPLPKASSLGRQYGLRLWLFAQNRNQIETSYEDADTILGNAVVQCWMNPDEASAFQLAQILGNTRGLLDGLEKPLAEAHALRGPEYRDSVIVIGRGEKPAKLDKHFAFADASLAAKLGKPVPVLATPERPMPENELTPPDAGGDGQTAVEQDGTSLPS